VVILIPPFQQNEPGISSELVLLPVWRGNDWQAFDELVCLSTG